MASGEDFWPEVEGWITASPNGAILIPADGADGERTLAELELGTWSTLGAVARNVGLLTVGDGWIRILGAGGPDVPVSLLDPFGDGAPLRGGLFVVAHDVLGGVFAVNGGALEGAQGHVHYLAPDTLHWESLESGHTAWLQWALEGDLDAFYGEQRREAWRREAEGLAPDQGLHAHPPLWLASNGPRSLRAVPLAELWSLADEAREQLKRRPSG